MRHMLRPHVGARPSTLSALAHWKLDDAAGANAADDLGAYDLTQTGAPGAAASLFAVPPGTLGSRTFDGSTEYFTANGDAAALAVFQSQSFALSAVFVNDTLSGVDTIFSYAGATSAQADNAQFIVSTSGDEIRVFWEYGSSVNVSMTTSGAGLSNGDRYMVVVSVEDDSPTTRKVTVYIFGGGLEVEQTFTGQTKQNGGTTADLWIGQNGRGAEYWDGTLDDVVVWKAALTRDAALLLYAETLGISYDEETLYSSGTDAHFLRVRVEDSAGTLVDLTDIAHGQNAVLGADVSDDIDSPGAQATVTIKREFDSEQNPGSGARWSLARDISVSPLNIVGGSFSPLLDLNRRILIDTAVIPEGTTPAVHDWVSLFEGYIGAVDWSGDEINVQCADKIGPLFDVFISEAPLSISAIDDSGTGGAVAVQTSTPHGLSQGDTFSVYNTTNYNGRYTVSGVLSTTIVVTVETLSGSLASESSGTLVPPDVSVYGSGAGTPLETVIQAIIDDNAPPSVGYVGGTPTLYTPTSPSFDLLDFYQDREPVQTALENLATMIGWSCRYLWDPEIRTFRLTLSEPDRALANGVLYTFDNDEILEVARASIDGKDIRNVVEITYSDSNATKDGAGQYPRVTLRKEDAASITAYGYRICQIAEGSTSQIDTYTEASGLADAVLSDLAEPKADIAVEVPFRRFVELGDYYRLPADFYHWETNKDVAVVGYAHSFSDGRASTTINLRGKPAAANQKWSIRMVSPGFAPNQPTTPPLVPPAAPTLTAISGGAEVYSPWPLDDLRGRRIDQMEIHASTVNNFVPSASTLKETIRSNRQDVHGLDPATTYYLRTRYRDRFGNYSPWSAQGTVTPRYVESMPAARAYRGTSDQAIPSKTLTPVQFNAEDYDKRSNYNTGTYKFTCPVSGVYSVLCHVAALFSSSGEDAQIYLYKNGGTLLATGTSVVNESHSKVAHPTLSTLVALTAADDVFIQIETSTTADILYSTDAALATSFFSIALVSQD